MPQRLETDENILQRYGGILLRMKNKGVIVAIRTPKITAWKEKH
jgi:hypothetical protein